MTIKTTYICECCGKEWDKTDKSETICTVSLFVGFDTASFSNIFDKLDLKQHWCRACVMKKGIKEPITESDKEVAPDKGLSFEEKVTELLDGLGYVREE